jgi:hypothetical protein
VRLFRIFNLGVCVVVLGIGSLIWQFNRPPFSLSLLEQLHRGMSTNEVQRVLGSPASSWMRTNDIGQVYAEWAYSREWSWPIVYVYFTPEGQFNRHEYDH